MPLPGAYGRGGKVCQKMGTVPTRGTPAVEPPATSQGRKSRWRNGLMDCIARRPHTASFTRVPLLNHAKKCKKRLPATRATLTIHKLPAVSENPVVCHARLIHQFDPGQPAAAPARDTRRGGLAALRAAVHAPLALLGAPALP